MPKNTNEQPSGQEVFYPETPESWRRWLEKNHLSTNSVWVVFYSKKSKKPSITWSQAVDVALCYGWIDSKKIKIDTDCSQQFFSRRKPGSTWSKINKQKVEKLLEEGKMRQAGIDAIEMAKQNGSWDLLDQVEELLIPDDLAEAYDSSNSLNLVPDEEPRYNCGYR
ncbi:YdeI/OmpD-associated family protein [Dyadobacter sp. MSC1_007]|jgi:uncharacterized protein YdeI (YjbR/CyaY-like superfamily)|uniref:YdeI/OmpD-associated family protein n=1 Tax=Dyadobacter sp. MSC1_007 TaxID=2909264 RepID=UPI00202F383F|nr:hypothetical protein [Dyadobacter sp. MSC1_007]